MSESLKEPKFYSFSGVNSKIQKMTGVKTALATKADKLRDEQELKKTFELKEKHKVELVELEASQIFFLFFHESLFSPDNESSSH